MKNKSLFISAGLIIYIVLSAVDRFVYHLPNGVYIPLALLGIAFILLGFFKDSAK